MSNAVAKVSFLQGQAWAKAPDGTLRALTVGSTLNGDEILVTAQGARVELDVGTGEPLVVNGGAEVGMSRDFLAETATGTDEALLSDASVQEALTVLEQGGDLLEELEETAAGNTGGGGSEGHDFVQLTRIIESTDPQAFDYSSASQSGSAPVENDANYINRAPLVTDQVIASNEDEPVTGQIIADDIEDDTLTFTIATSPANGALALDPVTGQFTFTPNANYNGTDGFVVTVTDSRGNSTNTNITLNIAPVNDAPTTKDINLTTDEDTPVNGQVMAQDIENDTLSYVVSGQPTNGKVVLDPVTGAFVYSPNANFNGSDRFVVTISDGNGGIITSTVTIGVNPVNDIPVSNDQNLVTDEDMPVSGQVVASDIDGDTLGYAVSGAPANGTVVLNPATGGFVYTPNANYNGSDSFVVTISDGKGGTTTSTITIGVNPVNDAPVSSNQNLSTPEDTPLNGQISATDIDGDTLGYAVSSQPTNGTVALNPATGSFVYTPNANYNGSDSFVVTISDGKGGTTTSTITIGVTPVNDAPTSGNLNLTTPEDTPVSGSVSASDIDGDSLGFSVSGNPVNGTVVLNSGTGSFTYTPNAGYNGSDSFTVAISDGNGGTTTSLVSIGVTPVNDGPTAGNLSLTTNEDVPVNGAISANDPDGDTLSYSVIGNPANGTVVLNPATGTFTYTPNAGYGGSDSFVVTVSDGNGGTATSTVTIGVNSLNDDPVASDLNLTTAEDTAVNGAISASDPDSDPLSYSVTGNPASGTVVLNPSTGTFVYTPNTNYNGSDSFVVTINDGKGGTTTSKVTINVTPDNDAPVTSDLALTTDEDTPINGSISASDPDSDPLSYSVTGSPTNGSVILVPSTGAFTYTPNAGYSGTDSFLVTVSDGKGGSVVSKVTVGVNPTNDAPITSDLSLNTSEDTPVNGTVVASDPDLDPIGYVLSGNPANGSVVLNPATGAFTYTPNANFNGSDSFVVTVSDGQGGVATSTITVGVTPSNDDPITADQSLTTNQNQPLSGAVTGSDPDGDALRFQLQTPPASGSLSLDILTGQFIYNPGTGFKGTDSFVVRVSDGKGGTALSTISIGVLPVNATPDAVDDAVSVRHDTAITIAVRANDTDADSDTLTVSSVTQGANGSVVIDSVTGNPIYTPNAGFAGTDTFTYTINDGKGGTDTATVTVLVTNAPSVMKPEVIDIPEDASVIGNLLGNDSDADDTLTIASFTVDGATYSAGQKAIITGYGELTVNTSGFFIFKSEPNYHGPVPVASYTTNTGASSTLTINITPTNDTPVARDDAFVTDEDIPLDILVADLLANDNDVDGDTVSLFSIGSATGGTVTQSGGVLTFTPTLNYSGATSFSYTITDGNGKYSTATVNITVNPVNDPAVMKPEVVSVPEDLSILGNVIANDVDVDDARVVASYEINGVSYAADTKAIIAGVGEITLGASGTYIFKGEKDYHGPVPVITYYLTTGASSTLTITVTPENDKPDAVDDSFTTTGGTALNIPVADLLSNDTDVDLDALSVNLVSSAVNGTVSMSGGVVTFTPNPGFTGTASFTYRVTDGNLTDTATVTIIVTPPAAVAPVTNDVSATGAEDSLITINLSGTDSDGTVVGYVIKSLPANGVLYSDLAMTTLANIGDLVAGPVYFKPDANWNGATDFDYVARDNDGLEDVSPGTATITVNPAADTAVLGSGTGTVKEDTSAQSSAAGTLTIVDPDAGEAGFQAQSNAPGTYGSFSIDTAGVWVYNIDNSKPAVQQLKEGESKTETFTVTSIDGTTTTVVITVKGTNDAPTATADTASVLQDNPLTLTPAQLLINDTDPDQDSLSIDSVQDAVNGSVSLVAGNVVFTPTPGFHGAASFTYTISDAKGGTSTATVNVTVDKANTPPVAKDDAALPSGGGQVGLVSEYYSYVEGTHGANLTSIQQAYSFIDGRSADATFIAKTFDYGASRSFSNGLGNGTNLQTFLGSDAASLSSDPGNSTDAIIRMRGFVELGAGTYLFKVTGDDGYQIRIDGVVVAEFNQNNGLHVTTHSQFTISSPGVHNVEIVYWDQGGYATLKLELSDNGGTTYNILSSVPSHQTAALSVVEDQSVSIPASSLLGNDTDADGDTLSISSVQGAVNGSVALVGGNVVFTPGANYSGPASFTYTISDSKGGSATATVNLVVTSVNDAPVAVGNTATVAPNAAVNIPVTTLLANDTDVDGDKLTIVSVQAPVNGSVSIVGGNVVFTPISNYEGPASFTYTARDPGGATSTATVNVNVGAATAPSLVVLKSLLAVAHGTGGISVKFPIVTALVDTDGSETLTVRISNVPTSASFNAGTNLGGGVWLMQESDLPNLMLNLPGSFSQSGSNMTVQVISTEANGGATASVSNTVMLHATYTTVDKTTTTSGNLTGTSANEHIVGGEGDNVIAGGNGNDIIYGGNGNDILSASSGSDMFFGGAGNDTITGSSGLDRISGGSGNDIMSAGADTFVDVFVWSLGDQDAAGTPAVDTINNFVTTAAGSNHSGGDVLDLRDLLQGEHVGANNSAGNLANYLHFEVSGGNTTIHISHTGGFNADSHAVNAGFTSSAETQKIVLNGVDLQSLYSGATTDQQIITQLLNNNKLITD